jgi:plastocyanin domain-containing protein
LFLKSEEIAGGENFLSTWGYRAALIVGVKGVPSVKEFHVILSSGSMRQADFTTAGVYAKAPLNSVIFHAGTRNAAATAAGMGIIRQSIANQSIADFFTLDGVALSTLVTD